MTQQQLITPPPELVQKWFDQAELATNRIHCIATRAAQWGADQELEACCEWFQEFYKTESWVKHDLKHFRDARRPKPPSLKQQALIHFDSYAASFETSGGDSDLIRRALEQLPDNE